jgi:hypothetical protein
MLDGSRDALELLGGSSMLDDDKRDQVLVLRGLLMGGMLISALEKRHLVQYGINR